MKNKRGFTLIELLVVIAIIGLLSTLAVVALNSARMKSRDARRVSDIKQVQTALELYFNDQSAYPTFGNYLGVSGTSDCLDNTGFGTSCSGATIYMAQVPSYPTPRTDGTCGGDADVGYYYTSLAGDTGTYAIEYCLGAATGGIAADDNVACESGVSGCSYDPN